MPVIPIDVYDKDGNLTRIEFYNELGGFEFQALWDENDEQTSEKRKEFREWCIRMAKNIKYEVKE
jgi:hypothetical protein